MDTIVLPPRPNNKEEMIKFDSDAVDGYHVLSNFYRSPITIADYQITQAMRQVNPLLDEWFNSFDVVTWPSSEHLWQSLKATTLGMFCAFLSKGNLGTLSDERMKDLFGPQFSAKKWMKKSMVGIMAKMAVRDDPKIRRRMGISDTALFYHREKLNPETERQVWLDILSLKFDQNPEAKQVLLDTGDTYLYEFQKGAAAKNRKEHWGACFSKGVFKGENAMGTYMMEIRAMLRASAADPNVDLVK
jgi:predicted NAD-dependent protein-ADP-ribosyltransferase YbiA (DUF1768 family)